MAGSHKSGVAAAKDFLFENAFYILTPSGSAGKEAVASLKDLLKGTNAKFVEMSPAEHDAVTSVISHFPHIVAASLVHQTVKFEDQYPLVKRFAAGGFRDITRIASSSPAMWRDILLHNKDKILERFDEWKQELDRIQSFVENEDADGLFEFFGKPRNTATVCLCGKRRDSFLLRSLCRCPGPSGVISKLRRSSPTSKSALRTSGLSKQGKT